MMEEVCMQMNGIRSTTSLSSKWFVGIQYYLSLGDFEVSIPSTVDTQTDWRAFTARTQQASQ